MKPTTLKYLGTYLKTDTKKNIDLLNLTDDLSGKHLKIATYNDFPLNYVETDVNGSYVGLGVAFTLIKILQERFNFTYDVVVPERNLLGGGRSPQESLIGLINASQADMAAAFIPRISRFQKMCQFSCDLDEGVWMMMLKRPKASAAGSGLMAPFTYLVWYLTLTAVLAYGPCITFITRLRSKLIRDKERHLSLYPSFWFVYSAFIKQGTNLDPEANATRVLFATWWIFIILLSAFYTANLTAFLTLSKFTLDIEYPEDLLKKNYRWTAPEGGSVQWVVKNPFEDLYYLNKMVLNGRAEFKNYVTDQDFLQFVDGGGVLVKESVSIDHIMFNDYMKKAKAGVFESDRCTYVIAPRPFMRKQRAFAYPVGSKLKDLFDSVLTHILHSGIVHFLQRRALPSTKICPLDLQSKDRQLRNTDLLMTYLIILVGLAAATAVFIGEVLVKRYYDKKNSEDLTNDDSKPKKSKSHNKRGKKSKRLDESDPPPYDSLFGNPKYNINKKTATKIINGREYYVYVSKNGDTRLIPVGTPSALLYR